MPFGGIKMVEGSCKIYGRELDPEVKKIFTEYRKTHNQGVFDVYTPDILRCRKSGVLTGLPDAYGRGRIIGDYRRVALYGVDFLMKDKYAQFSSLQKDEFVLYDYERIKYKNIFYNGVKSNNFLYDDWQIITLERLFHNFFQKSLYEAVWHIQSAF